MNNTCYFFITLIVMFNSFYISSNPRLNPRKIAVIGAHDEKYHNIGKYAHLNKEAYAKKHGYDFFLYNEILDTQRMGYWYKVIAIQKHLEDYDWLFWLDSDALIMNDTIKLENLIDDNFDLIITRDCGGCLNSGQFLIKNTKWSKQFLKAWYSLDHVLLQPGFDNGALLILYTQFEYIRERIKVVPQRMLSSYSQICFIHNKFSYLDGEYKEGDFIIHFAGVPHDKRAILMQQFYNKTLK